jgi:outer membrane protein insertion porin family
MTSFWKLLLFASAAVCCVLSATAQVTYTAATITFKNPADFSQQQLEDAAGMHPGKSFQTADLQTAAQKLSDTGYFDTVGAALNGPVKAVTVIFELKPLTKAQLLHAGFENFVWLTPEEIQKLTKAKVPLYNGYLPEVSALDDDVSTALERAVAAKGVQVSVKNEILEPTVEHPERVIEYRIVSPAVRVTDVHLSGVSTELVPYVQKSVNATAKTAYNDGRAGLATTTRILTPLLDAGYVEASLGDVTLQPTAAADRNYDLVVSATLQAGPVYHVGTITYAGSPLMMPEAFATTQKLHAGDVASHRALLETMAPLDGVYRRRGYMDVVATATPTLHEATHEVDYKVTVVPGAVYTVQKVTAEGLDPAQKADFDRGFTMKPGDPYNPEYVAGFLKNNSSLKTLLGYSANYKAYADPNAHTVELVMSFFKAR